MLDRTGSLLYVGKAKDLFKRVRGYFEGRHHGPHIAKMAQQIQQIEIVATASENDAFILEQRLIQSLKPKYNIIFRDDKTYPFIKIHNQPYEQVSVFRGPKKDSKQLYGPYADARMAQQIIQYGQTIFGIRTCSDSSFSNRSRPCVEHQLGRCLAPCTQLCTLEEYQTALSHFKDFVSGKDKQLVVDLTAQMNAAAQAQRFEEAGRLRDKIRAISAARASQGIEGQMGPDLDVCAIVLSGNLGSLHLLRTRGGAVIESYAQNFVGSDELDAELVHLQVLSELYSVRPVPKTMACNFSLSTAGHEELRNYYALSIELIQPQSGQSFKWLQLCVNNAQAGLCGNIQYERERISALTHLLGMGPLQRIECFDISHFQSEGAVASCVVWENGEMDPKQYRIFNISPEQAGDDFGSMREVLTRRFNGVLQTETPNLLLIDGGRAQMSKAQEALSLLGLTIPMLGMAKGISRKLGQEMMIPSWGKEPFQADKHNPGLLLLAHIRDESHRFAIQGNRKKVQKNRIQSVFETIPGIGPTRRKALILAFGSALNCKNAAIEDLQKVPGISLTLAQTIHSALIEHFS